MAAASNVRVLPLSCFIYQSEDIKPINKWSTYIKITASETYSSLKKRFIINDYAGFVKKAAKQKVNGKLDFAIGFKHKKPDLSGFPNGRLFMVNSEDE